MAAFGATDMEEAAFPIACVRIAPKQQKFADAAACYHRAEDSFPEKCAPRLERCYRELADFKKAYEYACKARELR